MKNQTKKNIEHVWSILCSNSVWDKESNNMSVFNLVEQLNITKKINKNAVVPTQDAGSAVPVNLELISLFKKYTPSEMAFEYELSILNPDGSCGKKEIKKFAIPKNIKNMRIRNKIGVINTEKSGEYIFVVGLKEIEDDRFREVARIPVEVIIKTEED